MNTQTFRHDTDLHQILAIAAAVFATAGGLIHLTVTRQHFDFPIVVAGFVLMGVAQWVFAFTIRKRPTTVVANTGGVLHAAIVAVWILSRTTGLAFVPGAEHVASVGVADIVATTFSVAVIGTVVMWRALSGSTANVNVPNHAAELGRTLDFVGVPQREKEEVLAAFAAHKSEVTEGSQAMASR